MQLSMVVVAGKKQAASGLIDGTTSHILEETTSLAFCLRGDQARVQAQTGLRWKIDRTLSSTIEMGWDGAPIEALDALNSSSYYITYDVVLLLHILMALKVLHPFPRSINVVLS